MSIIRLISHPCTRPRWSCSLSWWSRSWPLWALIHEQTSIPIKSLKNIILCKVQTRHTRRTLTHIGFRACGRLDIYLGWTSQQCMLFALLCLVSSTLFLLVRVCVFGIAHALVAVDLDIRWLILWASVCMLLGFWLVG